MAVRDLLPPGRVRPVHFDGSARSAGKTGPEALHLMQVHASAPQRKEWE